MQDLATLSRPGEAALDQFNQLARLRAMLTEVLARNPFWRGRLGDRPLPGAVEDFRRLPLMSNQELSTDIRDHPPFGSNLTYSLEAYSRYHQTSGSTGAPLPVLDTDRCWEWWCDCWDAVLDACGVHSGDRAFFAFSFAPFIGFWSAHAAVVRRHLLAVPGGGASTLRRLHLLRDTGCTVLFSTPTYAMHMVEVAERESIDIAASSIRCLILAGEPGGSMPTVRKRLRDAWNAEVFDHGGATEIGAYGIPCPQGRGLFLNEREFIAEVLALDEDHPVEEGHTGELVLTNLGRWGYPVIRYRTGDLVRPERLDEGLLLAGGILGRVDQMMVVRGVNLHPSAIEEAVRRSAGESEFRISVTRQGAMDEAEIEVEAAPPSCRHIAEDVRSTYGVRVEVKSVPRNSLPRWQAKAKRFRDLRE